MKITKRQLRRIIKEEVLREGGGFSLDKKISKALEHLEDAITASPSDRLGISASLSEASDILYDVLEDLRSDDPKFNPTVGGASE